MQRSSATVNSQRIISLNRYDDLTSANRGQELSSTTRPNLKLNSNVSTPAPSYQSFTVGTLVSCTLRSSPYCFYCFGVSEQTVLYL